MTATLRRGLSVPGNPVWSPRNGSRETNGSCCPREGSDIPAGTRQIHPPTKRPGMPQAEPVPFPAPGLLPAWPAIGSPWHTNLPPGCSPCPTVLPTYGCPVPSHHPAPIPPPRPCSPVLATSFHHPPSQARAKTVPGRVRTEAEPRGTAGRSQDPELGGDKAKPLSFSGAQRCGGRPTAKKMNPPQGSEGPGRGRLRGG